MSARGLNDHGAAGVHAEQIAKRYNVRTTWTTDLGERQQQIGSDRIRSLIHRVMDNDINHEHNCKLLQEKENYRIFDVLSSKSDLVTMKGVLLLQNSSCDEVMALLTSTPHMRHVHSDLFGAMYVDSTVLHEPPATSSLVSSRERRTSSLSSTPVATSMGIHWLMLRDLSTHLPHRDFVYMQYNQSYPTDDPAASHRLAWGASIYESIDLPSCEPIFAPTQVHRSRFTKCGFIVEASNQSETTRVTFFITAPHNPKTLQQDRQWLMKVASSVRFIPSAIVNHRIRLNQLVDKKDWRSRDVCSLCTQSYTLFKREHHCRMCGVSICSKCCEQRGTGNSVRVCLSCLNGEDTSALWDSIKVARKKLGSATYASSTGSWDQMESGTFSDSTWSIRSSESFSSCARVSAFDGLLEGDTFTISKPAPTMEGDEDDVIENTPFSYALSFANGSAWPDAPIPETERERLQRIQSLNLSQQFAKDNLKELLEFARASIKCPVATVSVISVSTSLLVTAIGLAGDQLPRDVALEAHVIMAETPLIVLDTHNDERFAMNPLVTSLHIRFYVGLPLVTKEGVVVGALSLGDTSPRERVSGADIRALQRIAARVVAKMDANNIATAAAGVSGMLLL